MASVPLSKVPSVTRLCELLGIQYPPSEREDSKVLVDTISSYIKSSTTSDGSSVTTLLDWNSSSVQNELRSAAVKFLEENDNGHHFWKPTRSWAQSSDLRYPEDRDKIIDILVQLFWKKNKNLHKNTYHNSKTTGSHFTEGLTDQSTPAQRAVAANNGFQRQTGKHPRDEHRDGEYKPSKREKHQIEEPPRRTERKTNPLIIPGTALTEDVIEILDTDESEGETDPATNLSSQPEMQTHANISASEGSTHTISYQNDLPNGPPTALKSSLSTESPATPTKVVPLEMPPSNQHIQNPKTVPQNPTAGVQSEISHIKIQNAASGGMASSGLEAFSTRHQLTPISTPAQYAMEAASASSKNDKATASQGSARKQTRLSSLGVSHSLNDAYGGLSDKPLTPSLSSATTSNAAKEVFPVPIQHIIPEPPIVSQAISQPSTPAPRSRIQIHFWIITWEPLYTEELWNDGKFQGFSLADFLKGITKVTQRSQIEKIKLTLRTPFSNTILTVQSDAEDFWSKVKATFAEKLKESKAEARARRVDDIGGYKILIEPFYEQIITAGSSTEADDDVFDY